MPTLLRRTNPNGGRNLGTLTSQDLSRDPTGSPLGTVPTPTGQPIVGGAVSTVSPLRRTPAPAVAPTPVAPDFTGLTPGSFAVQNTANNAGIYAPGSFGAQNAQANGTGYKAPQQTERANPLSGDNNVPMESTTTPLQRSPYTQRGTGVPSGRDALPMPVRDTATIDGDINQSMQGTFDNLRGGGQAPAIGGSGLYKRSFGNNQSASRYSDFVRRLFPDTSSA